MSSPLFHLYTFYRSSCSARLRITLNLKSVPYSSGYVKLYENEQYAPKHRELNPSGSVPVLIHMTPESDGVKFPIPQSIAALEYLEEVIPDHPLLPPLSQPLERAKVRTLVNVVACDIQPVTNRRTNVAIAAFGQSSQDWCNQFTTRGLQAYEGTVSKTAGRYSVGDQITLADVCLVPAVWNAEMYKVDLAQFPTVSRIYGTLSQMEAVQKAHWKNQPDTPEDGALL
ncbi:hypothetical protein H2203_007762 [Taxawa tesnikishii (nom. ined.)]|nr:hypothetical protein H2203_007762 [Dothideales sp. JES 119]